MHVLNVISWHGIIELFHDLWNFWYHTFFIILVTSVNIKKNYYKPKKGEKLKLTEDK